MNNKEFHDIDCKDIFSYMKGYTEFVHAFMWWMVTDCVLRVWRDACKLTVLCNVARNSYSKSQWAALFLKFVW